MLHRTNRRTTRNVTRLRVEPLEIRANPSHTLTVDDDGAQFPNAGFTSIQAAVNAAHAGDRIQVYAGTYQEQVRIPNTLNNLTLMAVGSGTATIAPPSFAADPTEAIVHVAGAKNVSIRGFLISGDAVPTGPTKGANYGVLVDQGGTADVSSNHIVTIRDLPLSGEQEGIGIQYGFTDSMGHVLSGGGGDARMNVIEDYQKGGVVVIGSASSAQVDHNTINGVGPTAAIAQNGIQISNGATAEVDHNTVTGNNYTNTETLSVGILVYATTNANVHHNSVSGNNEGIYLYLASDSTVEHNDSNHNTDDGIGLFAADRNQMNFNDTNNNGLDGIEIVDSNNNRVEHNDAFSNARYGISLEGLSTGNTVQFNHLGGNGVDSIFVGNPNNDVSNNNIFP
jgi:parallel beta-helix repeat protein